MSARTYSAGVVTAYGAAVAGGYEGTYSEFCTALGQLADVLENFEGFSVQITTLAEGSSATASYSDGVLTLGIPKGDKGDPGDVANLADAYDPTKTYSVGDHCTKDGQYKVCIVPITTAEAWNSAHWADAEVGEEIGNLKSAFNSIKTDYLGNVVPYYTNLAPNLYKENTYIHPTVGETALADYNLYRIPVKQGDVVFIDGSSGDTNFWGTLSNTYVFNFQHNDDSYTQIVSGTAYGYYTKGIKQGMFLVPTDIKYLMVTAYKDYAGFVKVSINTPFRYLDDSMSLYQTPIILTDKTAIKSTMYRQHANPDRFYALSGGYECLAIKIKAGDVVNFSHLIGSLTFYGTFTDSAEVTTHISTMTFTAPTDGLLCSFTLNNDYNCTVYPANALKIDYKNVLNSPYQNPYDGLDGVAFGTSLTYRAQTTGGYLQYLPALSGITFDNQGVGSSTILAHSGNPDMKDTITAYTGWSGKRVCILEGFVNDWHYNGASLGAWSDTGTTTVCGCVRYALNYILTQNSNLTVFLVLDHFGKGITAATEVNAAGDTQMEFYQEIEKVALSMGVRVIREYELSEISELTQQYLLDNIHMNELGSQQSANAIWSGMKTTYPNAVSE